MPHSPFFTLDNISIRLRNRVIIKDASWRIQSDQHWAILGPNGSGKSTLVRALWGGAPVVKGKISFDFSKSGDLYPAAHKEAIGYVAFELHQRLMEQESFAEELRFFSGKLEEKTTVAEVILSALPEPQRLKIKQQRIEEIAKHLDIHPLLKRSIAVISTGEMRKTLIARALMKSPKLLILDEPFDGLDESSRKSLAEAIDGLMAGPMRVILIAHRLEEIVPRVTHVLFMKEGKIVDQGKKETMLIDKKISRLYGCSLKVKRRAGKFYLAYDIQKRALPEISDLYETLPENPQKELIKMEDVTVRYGKTIALNHLNWMMKRGENWCILGPNGSGKSTIVKLILGDNLQGYSNQITLFGRRKGSGESVWDVKKYIGHVSAELQVQYRKNMAAYDVIGSGFYDSIGLYHGCSAPQKKIVERWIKILGISALAEQNFHHLSYGQKRMVLLARAMVKPPLLLIVDEPCHGLDIPNRKKILDLIEIIGTTATNLLYITHHSEEIVPSITNVLKLKEGKVIAKQK